MKNQTNKCMCVYKRIHIHINISRVLQYLKTANARSLSLREREHGRALGQAPFNAVLSLGTNSCQCAMKWSPSEWSGPTERRRQKSEFGADEAGLICTWDRYGRKESEGVKVKFPQIPWLWTGLSVPRMRLYNLNRSWQLWGEERSIDTRSWDVLGMLGFWHIPSTLGT